MRGNKIQRPPVANKANRKQKKTKAKTEAYKQTSLANKKKIEKNRKHKINHKETSLIAGFRVSVAQGINIYNKYKEDLNILYRVNKQRLLLVMYVTIYVSQRTLTFGRVFSFSVY